MFLKRGRPKPTARGKAGIGCPTQEKEESKAKDPVFMLAGKLQREKKNRKRENVNPRTRREGREGVFFQKKKLNRQ